MNIKLKRFMNNFSFVMFSNLYSLIISTIITILIPRFFSQLTYSYFQLENLYCGYIWIISIGWNDGFYIKYGGCHKKDLQSSNISSLLVMSMAYSFLVSLFVIICGYFIINDVNKQYVFIMAAVSVGIEIITNSLKNLLQAVNSMKQFGVITFIDRTIYFVFVVFLILIHSIDFKVLIAADIISKFILLGICVFMSKDFIFNKISPTKKTFKQAMEIISIGIT